MKIDGYTPLPESSLPKQEAAADRSATTNRTEGSVSARNAASLSVHLETKGLLESEIAKTPDLRQDRVASLQSALQEGRYQVSDEQIAASMLNDLLR